MVNTAAGQVVSVPRFRVQVLAGPDAGAVSVSEDGRMTIGTADGVTLRLTDPTVSRFHAELEATPQGIALRDLGSTNGTRLGAVSVREIVARSPVEIEVGRTRLRLLLGAERAEIAAAPMSAMGSMLGGSAAMRAIFNTLAQAAPTTAPVLITGESGTG